MQLQETITNATANLSGSTATALIALVGVAAFAFGAEQVAQVLDVQLPLRQLTVGRNLQALTLSFRFSWTLAGSYVTASKGVSVFMNSPG